MQCFKMEKQMKKELINFFISYKILNDIDRSLSLYNVLNEKHKNILAKLEDKLGSLNNTLDENLDFYLITFDSESGSFVSQYKIHKKRESKL